MRTVAGVALGQRPALTGLRGVAAAVVVVHHLFPGSRFAGLGWLGVAVFYTLSGFLITKLLLEERDRDGRVDVLAFYRRRARRLLPALWFAVGSVLLFSAVTGWLDKAWIGCVAALGYVGNFVWMSGHDLGPVGDTYTLAVEEHFYLAWPWLFPLVARRSDPVRLLLWVVGLVVAVRAVLVAAGVDMLWTTTTAEMCADRILVGAALAFVMHRRGLPRVHWGWPAAGLGVLSLCADLGPGMYVLAAVATVGVLAAVLGDETSLVARVLACRPLVAIGTVSYGLYLWHYITFWFTAQTEPLTVARSSVALAIAVVMTVTSWVLVERPISRRRQSISMTPDHWSSSPFAQAQGWAGPTLPAKAAAVWNRIVVPPVSMRATPGTSEVAELSYAQSEMA